MGMSRYVSPQRTRSTILASLLLAAFAINLDTTIFNVFAGRAERATAIGFWGATAGAAIALGPIVGGWLLEHFSWTSIFFAMAPVAAAAAVFVASVVPTSRDPQAPRIDRGGLVFS